MDLKEAIFEVTSGDKWETVQEALFQEIKATEADVLNLHTWEDVNEAKGFIRGLLYVITLREQVKVADANV